MNLGERCDEIVRLIDETLADVAVEKHDGSPAARAPMTAGAALVLSRRLRGTPRPAAPDTGRRPDRTAAGF